MEPGLGGVKSRLEKHRQAHSTYLDGGARLLDLSQQAVSIYHQLEMAEKKRILTLVLANSIWLNAQLIPKYRQPFDLMTVMKTKTPPMDSFTGEKAGGWKEWYTRQESNL